MAAEVLDEGSAAPRSHVTRVDGQDGHQGLLLGARDLLDYEARDGASVAVLLHHPEEEGARRPLAHALPELAPPAAVVLR